MELRQRTRRFGWTVILCALIFRLFTGGFLERVVSWLMQPNIAAFLIYAETGRDVRFSASMDEARSPHALESPAPWIEEPALPVFSAEDATAVEVTYSCSLRPSLEELLTQPLDWELAGEEPTVLILHSHATESYTPSGEAYTESSDYRTLNEDYNMLCVGQRLAEVLAQYGIRAVQDRSLHDYPDYNGAYSSARTAIREALEEYPTIRLVLDLHRDALEGASGQLRTTAQVDGKNSAQLMLVMGTDAAGLTHENWEDNLSLALKLQLQLERLAPGITRPISLRSQRFNQDLSTGALLVEVGAAGNTRAEALLAAETLGRAIAALAGGAQILES